MRGPVSSIGVIPADAIVFWSGLGRRFRPQIEKGILWLLDHQNADGGWAAFHQDRQSSVVVEALGSSLMDSAEMFDPSCVDLTGHVLEALHVVGMHYPERHVLNAVNYIRSQQNAEGAFAARWGVNYIYGTSAALVGVARSGAPMKAAWIGKAVAWMMGRQREDGGWGEATMSYTNASWAGRAKVSTASQTAWALLGLLEARRAGWDTGDSVERGVEYLIRNFRDHGGQFIDDSSVGTGHRGLLFMQYPSYASSFTLMALGRYLNYSETVAAATTPSAP